ncbi:MAG TPA: outer membrane beta-barrel protein [Chthoniobacterales bacterium]|nr:outer membrane beta-barrel protein [Chthoniobacterales bacterium]
MKRLIALTVVVIASIGLLRIAFAGPEAFSGKEMKQVAPPPLPECNWTGFYFGGLAGYAGGTLDWTDQAEPNDEGGPGVTTLVNKNQSGFIGGGELGFNYQWRCLVLGVEGTFSYSDLQGHTVKDFKNADEPNAYDTRSDWQGTISGRAGFAWNKFLFYAKGGGAFVQQRYSWLHGDNESELVDTFKTDETRVGALVGGGLEYMISCHWSAKVEYNHFFLGKDTISGTRIDDGVGQPESYDVDLDQDSVQVGINYKFWGF